MDLYILQQDIEIIKILYKNGEKLAETARKRRTFFGVVKNLVGPQYRNWWKIELFGQVSDVKNKTRARCSRIAEYMLL